MTLLKFNILALLVTTSLASTYKLNLEINHSGNKKSYKNIKIKDGEKTVLDFNGQQAVIGLISDKSIDDEALKFNFALKSKKKNQKPLDAEILMFVGDQAEFETVDNKSKESLNIIVEASE
ncbi:MAG: hypothetical protein VX341_00820 [Bdellovibrionota bacterium]|nr:hypothetical protein [Bdellovibrionota bacterium]